MRSGYVVLGVLSIFAAAAFVGLVFLPAHVLYGAEKDSYADAVASVAFCDTTDVTTMPESHRQEHFKTCARSREILRRRPTLEAALSFVITDYVVRSASVFSTWKFALFATAFVITALVGGIFVFDRYVTRQPRKGRKNDVYDQ